MKFYRHCSRFDCESALRHHLVSTGDRNRHHRDSAFHREIERSFLEWQQLAVERALAFDIDRHVEALLHYLLGGAHRFDASVAIAAIDRHERSHPHRAAQDWIVEQFLFHHYGITLRDKWYRDGVIHIRYVI